MCNCGCKGESKWDGDVVPITEASHNEDTRLSRFLTAADDSFLTFRLIRHEKNETADDEHLWFFRLLHVEKRSNIATRRMLTDAIAVSRGSNQGVVHPAFVTDIRPFAVSGLAVEFGNTFEDNSTGIELQFTPLRYSATVTLNDLTVNEVNGSTGRDSNLLINGDDRNFLFWVECACHHKKCGNWPAEYPCKYHCVTRICNHTSSGRVRCGDWHREGPYHPTASICATCQHYCS
jgi:hypothetical protein